jgi:type I restriction enzyme S subunit
MAKLGEVCTIVSGSTPKTSVTSYWDGNIKWITPAELNEDTFYIMDSVRHITEEGKEKTGLSYLPTGTVILSSRAPIGKTAIAGCKMCCNQGFKNLICSDAVYNEYLYFFLKSKTDYLNSLGRGATFKEISKSIVENIEIPLPEVNQQKEIAEKFKKLEQLISLRKQQLAKLDELVKARFVEMFGNPSNNSLGFPYEPLSNCLLSIENGKSFVCSNDMRQEENPAILKLSAVTYGVYQQDENKAILDSSMFVKSAEVHKGDLLFTRKNTPELVGMCAYVNDTAPNLMMPDLIFRLNTNEKINKIFLWKLINHEFFRGKIQNIATGSAKSMSNISKERLEKLAIILPPLHLQNDFAALVERVDQQKQTVQQSLEKLELMKKALMQEYFG